MAVGTPYQRVYGCMTGFGSFLMRKAATSITTSRKGGGRYAKKPAQKEERGTLYKAVSQFSIDKKKGAGEMEKKKYIRFGEVPKSEKSVNFINLSFDESANFNYEVEQGNIDEAYSLIPPDALEDGVSVFDCDKHSIPILSSLRLVKSLLARLDSAIYLVEGEEVGRGQDGEPLIRSVTIVKKRRIKKEILLDLVLEVLIKNFENASFDAPKEVDSYQIYEFGGRERVNKKSGERVSEYEEVANPAEWVLSPLKVRYCWMGWTFSNPVKDFAD